MQTHIITKAVTIKSNEAVYKKYSYQSSVKPADNRKKPGVSFNRKKLLRRLSPFHLLVLALVALFMYNNITNNNSIIIKYTWLQIFLYAFIIVNVIFADFALWNYLEGKRKLLIWVSELVASSLILYGLA